MMPASFSGPFNRWLAGLLLVLVIGLAGCGPEAQMLRVTNRGSRAIARLVVRFPEDRVDFGALEPGATSAYHPVPHGVYAYAAYEVTLDGRTVQQPVTDWVGEKPLAGLEFTYTIAADPAQNHPVIQLLEVKRDRP
jgi:hypothetical protein